MLKPTWVEIGYGINKPSFPSDQAPKRKPQPQKAEAEQVRTGMSQLYPVAAGKMKDPDAGRSV